MNKSQTKTVYQNLASRRDAIQRAEQSCTERGRLTAAFMWQRHRAKIEAVMGEMSVHDAGQEYDARRHVAGVLVRDGHATPYAERVANWPTDAEVMQWITQDVGVVV